MAYLDSDVEPAAEVQQDFDKLIDQAAADDFEDLESSGLFQIVGKNPEKQAVAILVPCFIGSSDQTQMDRCLYVAHEKHNWSPLLSAIKTSAVSQRTCDRCTRGKIRIFHRYLAMSLRLKPKIAKCFKINWLQSFLFCSHI
eukprot:GHVT01096651.1.p1 GENE.GHVT01096651.1~~GHVT01096651.1.p1  ORF type:complete len:141 (+),score=14.28 GHVT01096651.1:185-607(+)